MLSSLVVMAGNQSLISRIAASAAQLNMSEPVQWAQLNIWSLVSTEGWVEAWDYAAGQSNINVNPDTGIRNDVITDQMIHDAVAAVVAEQTAPAADPGPEPTA